MAEFNAGDQLTAAKLNRRGIQLRGNRVSVSTGSTSSTAVGVERVDSISVISGRTYVINVSCHPNSTVITDTLRIEVRGSTSGNATTSSGVLASGQAFPIAGTPLCLRFVYPAGSTATLSILLCQARNGGSGTCSLFADGTRNTELWIEDMGVAADTGVDV